MPNLVHRFELSLRLLTTLILSLCALGLLFIRNQLGIVTSNLSSTVCISLGLILYTAGIFNQAYIFIKNNELYQKGINLIVALCLGMLSYLYFHARFVITGFILVALVCAQIYMSIVRSNEKEAKENIFSLVYAGLELIAGCIILLGVVDFSKYQILWPLRFYLGFSFIGGGLAGVASCFLYPQIVSSALYKLTAVPWLIWVFAFTFASQIDTVLVAFGVAVMPLLTDTIAWNGFQISDNHRLGRKIISIAGTMEFLLLIILTATGYNRQPL